MERYEKEKGEKVMNELCFGVQKWNFDDVDYVIDDFMKLYENRPIINNRGGCRLRICFGRGILSEN